MQISSGEKNREASSSIALRCSVVKFIVKNMIVEIKNSRIGKYGSAFQFWVIRCVLAGDNRYFPLIIPKQSDLGMNGGAPVIKTIHQHLERQRAHCFDAVINQYPEREDQSFVDTILQLLDAGLAE